MGSRDAVVVLVALAAVVFYFRKHPIRFEVDYTPSLKTAGLVGLGVVGAAGAAAALGYGSYRFYRTVRTFGWAGAIPAVPGFVSAVPASVVAGLGYGLNYIRHWRSHWYAVPSVQQVGGIAVPDVDRGIPARLYTVPPVSSHMTSGSCSYYRVNTNPYDVGYVEDGVIGEGIGEAAPLLDSSQHHHGLIYRFFRFVGFIVPRCHSD